MIKRLGTLLFSCMLILGMTSALSGCSQTTYVPEEKSPTVASPVIGKNGTLRVGVTQRTPFAGQVSGKLVGLDIDIAAALADGLGLKLEVVDVGSEQEAALAAGTVDIVMGLDKADTALTCWRSDVYIESGVALFAKPGTTTVPTKDSSPTIAAQNSSMSAWEVRNQFGEASLVGTTDLTSAFDQLNAGTVAYAAADAVIGSYTADSSNVDAVLVALMQNPSGYCIGVLESNTELTALISDALVSLTGSGMIPVIESKWLGAPLVIEGLPQTEGTAGTTGVKAGTPASTTGTQGSAEATAATGDVGANAVQPDADNATNAAAA